jgi:tetratricopeptide (TPR) repeat protein
MKIYPFLLPLILVSTAEAEGAPLCQLDEAQALFDKPSPDHAAIRHLLQACVDTGSTDYRAYMLLGVTARDQHDLDDAAKFLERAHDLAPKEASPALELAVTDEWRNEPDAARALYEGVLSADPTSRPALLGLARVDRSQYRFDQASEIYNALLRANPKDVDARNGLAAIALANRELDTARAGFQSVLKDAPGNAEAQAGLAGVDNTWRYQLDLTGGAIHSNTGTAGSGGADLLLYVNATDAVELGALFNSDELPSPQLTEQTLLPSDDFRVGFYRNVPSDYHWSVTYDYRSHDGLPSEHWLQANVGSYFADGLQWFLNARESFGDVRWNNQLIQAGLDIPLTGPWDVAVSGYFAHSQNSSLMFPTGGRRENYAVNADIERQGPGNSFFLVGAGYSPDIDNTDVHARLVLPVTDRTAFLFSIEHVSINDETQATVGWRFFFQ